MEKVDQNCGEEEDDKKPNPGFPVASLESQVLSYLGTFI